MKETEPQLVWTNARNKPELFARERAKNIFAGGFEIDSTAIESVEVLRLSVWPKGATKAPRSYAVEDRYPDQELEEEQDDEAPMREYFRLPSLTWQKKEEARLPLEMEWQQSSESLWELFFKLPLEARCLGLGERLHGLNRRGCVHTLFNTDNNPHVPSIDSMYKSIPFLIVQHHQRCYGIFLDSPARQRWLLDTEMNGSASVELLSRRGWQLYLFSQGSLSDVVHAYTTLTGRSKLPPVWSLGHQQSRWSYPDEETVRQLANEFRQRRIPCDGLVLDIDYMDDYRVFTSSQERFPNFKQMIEDLSAQNFKVTAIIDPGVKKDGKFFVFSDGKKHDYFCKRADGKPFFAKVWPGMSAFPDFIREDVRLWWAALHGFHAENGVCGIWNDMNEPAMFDHRHPLDPDARELPPDDKQMFVQKTPEGTVGHFEVRNLYGMEMCHASQAGMLALKPLERPFVLSRSGYAGIQRYAAVWLGDNSSWWEHLAMSIPMLVNMGLSGVPFCGVDVGGFSGDASPELLVRWYAAGIFYPFFRNHCALWGRPQEPWSFGPLVEQNCRKLIEVRYRLLPYIQQLFYEHMRSGAPLMRPLSWQYPDDEFAAQVEDQFMFGRDFLVTPILKSGQTMRSVYLPSGRWHSFEGDRVLEGGRLHQVAFKLAEVPAFVREGAVVPLADVMQSTDEYATIPITFSCYGDSGDGVFIDDDGWSNDYTEGRFNEWLVIVEEGKFRKEPIHMGYRTMRDDYRLSWKGKIEPIRFNQF